ncbi:hypothetical protein [Phytohabitans houttuyneae]|uniref:Uncharacterized protein n=1 Tax=Phytohabitans houttuyneae TaxID=1076126 RepID=A0A6V8KA12_9ACTN|nr:hypothetical protein [Phytohabitans houttuyneae]GFJ78806.1 hypothetical protein Phou_029860 [Phytohabitans houttuyneae]
MFVRVHVAARRKPQAGLDVVDQQDVALGETGTTYDTRCRGGVAGFSRRKTSSVLSSQRSVSR